AGPHSRAHRGILFHSRYETYQQVRKFAKRFKARHESILCRDLVDLGKSPVSVVARRKQFSTHCPKMVQTAVEILEEMLGDKS
ncbi:MAG: C_GCAxxG_C_C family protein, partial [Planctomycetes bacterium]|nr:C_GCAxxG_C_C family protein [Planctomycetota bacterium]